MIQNRKNFGDLLFVKGTKEGRANAQRTIDEDLGQRSPTITALTESADVLEEWFSENYREIVDTTEYLDSSRVKRID